jgi:hypothetical protein
MVQTATYSQTLRALGQALEAAHLDVFSLQSVGEVYHVRGEKLVEIQAPSEATAQLTSIWQKLKRNGASETPPVHTSRQPIQLQYTSSDIEQLEREGQARRQHPHSMPDVYSPSQVLRAAGAYLDRKRAKLVELAKNDANIKMRYETSLGAASEELSVPYLYDMAVRMYLRRTERPKEAAAS